MSDRRLVMIRWMDHFTQTGWHDVAKSDLTPMVIDTIGWLVGEDDKMINISPTITDGGRTDFSSSILKCAIVHVWDITFIGGR